MRRIWVVPLFVVLTAGPAHACGGLIGPNGAVNLTRTTTLAAYADGAEHYVTAFEFAGDGGAFGSIVPLPGVPETVERGGDWTLQRLEREVRPVVAGSALAFSVDGAARAERAEVILETKVDALDITVLRGGGRAVGEWAEEHGFLLSPDAPALLDFYAARSPIFLAASFDGAAAAARGQRTGDGTPVHITIRTDNPWVPLRILGLGKQPAEVVSADVFLLTDRKPALLPVRASGLRLERREPARPELLDDLRSDAGMSWVPSDMWLTHVTIDGPAAGLRYDLAVDRSGAGKPSRVAAGLPPTPSPRVEIVTPSPVPATQAPTLAPTAVPLAMPVSSTSRAGWLVFGAPFALATAGLFVRRMLG